MTVAIGIGVALLAAVAHAYAVVLQATEARQAPDREGLHVSLLRRLAHRPRWLAGTGLMTGAWPLQLVALAMAPIAVVQPMLATSQLVLLGAARATLGERIGRREVAATLALVAGLAAVVWAAPGEDHVGHASAASLAAPMAVVGVAASGAYLAGRAMHRARLLLVIGAGVAYSWSDFVSKLLAGDASNGRWALAGVWTAAAVAIGALAFLEENTALQHRPAMTVAPVVSAVKVPLPVLMALWSGVAAWGGGALSIAALLGGLALVTCGAAALGSSTAVARVSGAYEHRQPARSRGHRSHTHSRTPA